MKKLKASLQIVTIVAVLVMMLVPIGCEKQSPIAPAEVSSKVVKTSDQIRFLKNVNPGFAKTFLVSEWVTVASGGLVTVGDENCGHSFLDFLPGDLPADTTITFGWDSNGYITDLMPHGIVFNSPVELALSYKDADLSGLVEDSLRIWYFNDNTNLWELVGGTVNTTDKVVEGYIEHFSRYALGDAP